jgi:hypothetical protein
MRRRQEPARLAEFSIMKKEALVFVLLALGVAAAFAGFALVSRGTTEGWIAIAIAAPMLFIAQRSMRVVRAPDTDKPTPDASTTE